MGYISQNLGQKIKELRERNNLTQLKLAELINMESSNLSKLERGIQMPKEESIQRIAEVLNADIQELFDFGHLKTKQELIEILTNTIRNSSLEELRTYYKIINSIKELYAN